MFMPLAAGLLVIALALVLARKPGLRRFSGRAFGRRIVRDDRGAVIAIGERQRAAGQWRGYGSEMSAPLQLRPGTYRLDYRFEVLTRLALVNGSGDETLLITSGTGATTFAIDAAGRYRLLIEPTHERAAWRVAYRQVATG